MKYILTLFLMVLYGLQMLNAQDIKPVDSVILNKEHVVGRWIEEARFNNENDSISKQPYTYIFKDDQIFHRGSAVNEMLIFNVAGRFQVENDTITIYYRDYLNRSSKRDKALVMSFRVVAWSDKEMTVIVTAPDSEEYMVILAKQSL